MSDSTYEITSLMSMQPLNITLHRFISMKERLWNINNIKSRLKIQNLHMYTRYPCWRRQWHPTPVLLPGKSHGRRSLVGYSPWGHEESDTTERLHFHFSLSCIGEGNGNPLQCSCLENPRDGGAWWAAVCGIAQSRTRLKRLSSSSSTRHPCRAYITMLMIILTKELDYLWS